MSQEIIQGEIVEMNEDGGIVIVAAVPSVVRALVRKYKHVEIGLCDGRHISPEQRRKIYAIFREISDWMGDDENSVKQTMKMDFIMNRLQGVQRKMFSLSDVDMNTASEFISYLIEFMLEHDISCQNSEMIALCEDITKYVYACLMNKKCCVCGAKSDLHHLDTIGMGNDREEVHHLGRETLPLCREHHTECHSMGNESFMKKYHLQAVKINEQICKKYKLKR